MTANIIIEKTLINASVTVITLEAVRPGMIVGVHPCLQTNVIGLEGIDARDPYRMYINQHAARIGHDIVVDEVTRMLVEIRAIASGISPALVAAAL